MPQATITPKGEASKPPSDEGGGAAQAVTEGENLYGIATLRYLSPSLATLDSVSPVGSVGGGRMPQAFTALVRGGLQT